MSIQLNMWSHGFQFAGYYAAIEKGFYAKQGLHVTLKERSEDKYNVESVLDGEAEYGVADTGLLLYRMDGAPVVLLTQIFQHSPLIFIAKRESGILSPYDMLGKKVMMELRIKYEAPLYAMIQETLGGISKINAIQHTFNYNDFFSDKADAIATFITDQPFLMKELGVEINIINPQSYGMAFYGDNLFTTEKEILDNPGRVERMILATLDGWKYALNHKDEIIDLIRTSYSPSSSRELLEYEAKMVDLLIMPDLIPLGEVNPARYEWTSETFARLEMTKSATVPDGFIYQRKTEPTLAMKPEERVWLSQHRQIRVGVMNDWPPLNFTDESGTPKGIGVDYIALINKRLGHVLIPEAAPFNDNFNRVMEKKLDASMDITPKPEREPFFHFTTPYLSIPHVIVGRRNEPYFDTENALTGKTVAVEKGFYNTNYIRDNFPQILTREYASTRDALDAVSRGEADAYIGNRAVVTYLIEKELLTNLQVMGKSTQPPVVLAFGVRKDWPELASILDRALASLTQEELRDIRRKWTYQDQETEDTAGEPLLTQEEKEWLQQHHHIRLGIDPYHPPFDYLDSSGTYSGIASDYVEHINRQLDLEMMVEKTDKWSETIEKAIAGEIDVLPCCVQTSSRFGQFHFTQPYLRVPLVILTRDDRSLVNDLGDFADGKVAIIKDYATYEFLIHDYPKKKFLFVDDLDDAVTAVSRGKADAFVGDLESIRYAIRKMDVENLSVAATTPYTLDFAFAVRKDWPELAFIIDKTIQAIPGMEKKRFQDRWTQIQVERQVNWSTVWWIALSISTVFFFIFVVFIHWNRRLAREIIERRRIEDALRESEVKYRTLVQNLNIGVYRNSAESQGRFIEANPAIARMFGYDSVDKFLQVPVVDLYCNPDDRNAFLQEIHREGAVWNRELNLKRIDNESFWASCTAVAHFDALGGIKWIDGVIADVTERRELDEHLRRYEFITNSVEDMMSLVNRNYVYEAVNDKFCKSVCKEREDIIGFSVIEMWGKEKFDHHIRPNFDRCFKGEKIHYELWLEIPHEGKRYCSVLFFPYRNKSGEITHSVVVTRDITPRKLAEEKLMQAMEAADVANQAKSAFLAAMSHELRTPLNSIIGFTGILLQGLAGPLNDEQHKQLDMVRESSRHLLALINDVLDISKIEAGELEVKREPFDMKEAVDKVIRNVSPLALKKNLMLSVDVPLTIGIVSSDRRRIEQVLINLINNAIKFTNEGEVRVRGERNQDRIIIHISDTGIGIRSEDLHHLFKPFRQLDVGTARQHEGTGLGLSICKKLLDLLDGEIQVESRLGEGSTFSIAIPVYIQEGRS